MSPPADAWPHVAAVDDDPAIRDLLVEYLGANELRVSALATGAELMTLIARETVDLVVLDVRLQRGEDGLQIARRLRETSATIPILMLTGRAEEADRVMGLELGADDYLTKPFSSRELLARIRALLRRAQAQASVADTMSRARAYRFAGWEVNIGLRRLKNPQGQPVDRRADPAPAPQDRSQPGQADVHRHAARRGLPVRRGGRSGALTARRPPPIADRGSRIAAATPRHPDVIAAKAPDRAIGDVRTTTPAPRRWRCANEKGPPPCPPTHHPSTPTS